MTATGSRPARMRGPGAEAAWDALAVFLAAAEADITAAFPDPSPIPDLEVTGPGGVAVDPFDAFGLTANPNGDPFDPIPHPGRRPLTH